MWKKYITYWNNTNNKVGKYIFRTKRKTPLSSTRSRPSAHRAKIYFELEKEVRDVMVEFMKKKLNIKLVHVIHDGFLIKNKLVLINEVITEVKNKLGYQISLSEEKLRQEEEEVINHTPSTGFHQVQKKQTGNQEAQGITIMVLPCNELDNEINHLTFQDASGDKTNKTNKTTNIHINSPRCQSKLNQKSLTHTKTYPPVTKQSIKNIKTE